MNLAIAVKEPVGSLERSICNYMAQEFKEICMEQDNFAVVYLVPNRWISNKALPDYLSKQISKTEERWNCEFDVLLVLTLDDTAKKSCLKFSAYYDEYLNDLEVAQKLAARLRNYTTEVESLIYPIIENDEQAAFELCFEQNSFDGISFTRNDIRKIYTELQKII